MPKRKDSPAPAPVSPEQPFSPNQTLTVTLTLISHDTSSPNGRRATPDLSRLTKAAWWNAAIWGRRGMNDPMPKVVEVEVKEG